MGTVDIEQTVEEVMQSDNLYWDGENPSYEEVEKIVRDVVKRVTERHYSMNDGEIDDWDVWEQDVMVEVNGRLEALEE
jgi:hypothetical protein